ncbi:MAG: HEAT repeat domain-containing protein [Caulobacterales bacterium]
MSEPRTLSLQDPQALAERWFALAVADDLPALTRVAAVSKRRLEAAKAVMRVDAVRYEAFVQALLRGLGDPRPRLRFECAHALDQFGDERCRGPLAALLDDPVPRVRWMAMHALSCHACGEGTVAHDPAVRARITRAALEDPSIQVRRHAAVALGLNGDAAAADSLRKLASAGADARLKRNAAWALSRLAATRS